MKNLKKVLALVLVVATLMGFATVASATFTDASSIEYKEAVDVMEMIGVIDGFTDGSFRPEGNVTRAQMAKMVAYIVAGGEDVGDLYAGANTFSDCTTHWAKGYIAYANKTGIVAGVGNGLFRPDGSVTGTQAAKMMLCALGYDAAVEEYTGTNWAVNTLADAREAGLLKGLSGVDMSKAMTREQAAQLMLNALKADMVRYENKGSEVDLGNGVIIRPSASDAEVVTTKDSSIGGNMGDKAAADGTYTLQLAEKYFEKLTLAEEEPDDFGRKGAEWTYNKETVGPYASEADYALVLDKDYTYTESGADLYAAVLKDLRTLADNKKLDYATDDNNAVTTTMYYNGETGMKVTPILQSLKAGTVVELFCDGNTIESVVIYTRTVGKVTKVSTNKDGDVTYYIDNVKAGTDYADPDEADDIVVNGTVEKGDIVTMAKVGATTKTPYVFTTTAFEGTQTASKTKDGITTVTIDGKTYTVSGIADKATFKNSKDAANYYLDEFGALVYTDSKAVASTDYAYIVGYNADVTKTVDGETPYVEVRAVLSDGTVGVYELALEEDDDQWTIDGIDAELDTKNIESSVKTALQIGSNNTSKVAFGYTVDGSVMTLETVKELTGTLTEDTVYTGVINGLDSKTTSYTVDGKTVLINDNTKFVAYGSSDKTATVYDGINKLPGKFEGSWARFTATANNSSVATASYVFLYDATTEAGSVDTYVYIDANDVTEALDADNETVYEYNGINPDGTTVTLTAKKADKLTDSGLYTYSEDNKVTKNDKLDKSDDAKFLDSTKLTVVNDMVGVNGKFYYMTEDTQVVYVDDELSDVDGNVGIVVLEKDDSNNIAAIFVTAAGK